MLFPKFESMEDMMAFYYPSLVGARISKGNLIRKGAGNVETTDAAWFNDIYGKKVWSFLNLEANIFAILPKEPWTQSGWRVMTSAAHTLPSDGTIPAGGVAESAALPATYEPTIVELSTKPRTIIHGFNTSELAEFLSSVDDSVDILPFLREEFGKEHARLINGMLGRRAEHRSVDDTTSDLNFESLDVIVSSKAEVDGNSDLIAAEAAPWQSATVVRTGTTYDAIVNEHDNSARDLTLAIIDSTFKDVIVASGEWPNVILTHVDTAFRWEQLLEAERRYMDTARVVPTFGGVRGVAPGVEAGFMVATYHGLPIIESIDVPTASSEIGNIYFLNTNYLRLRVAKPTRYYETEPNIGMVYLDDLAIEGYFETMGQLIATRFNCHGKIVDLK